MSRTVRLLLAGAVTLVAVVAGVLVVGDDEDGAPAPESGPPETPLASFDTSTLTVLRTAFCDRVPAEAVEAALGAEPGRTTAYGNGDVVRLTPEVRDRAHEFGCRWRVSGARAQAWVFLPPVTEERARELARTTRKARGCRALPDAPAYGEPSVAVGCRRGPGTEVSFRGLFGDAWLTCTLDVPGEVDDAAVDRVGRWCVAVATAATGDGAAA